MSSFLQNFVNTLRGHSLIVGNSREATNLLIPMENGDRVSILIPNESFAVIASFSENVYSVVVFDLSKVIRVRGVSEGEELHEATKFDSAARGIPWYGNVLRYTMFLFQIGSEEDSALSIVGIRSRFVPEWVMFDMVKILGRMLRGELAGYLNNVKGRVEVCNVEEVSEVRY